MILSDVSIKRPVLASVISLLILLAGIAAYLALPVRQYPDITRPVVSVTTVYTGASPETVEATITNPLEESLNSIDDIRDISSQSSFGVSAINIEFKSNRNVDAAVQDVTNAVSKAINKLPDSPNVQRPVVSKVSSTAQPIIWLVLQGEHYSLEQLSQMADLIVKRRVEILPGVGNVIIGGEYTWAMRIWLNPAKMTGYGMTVTDVVNALAANNVQLPGGQIKSDALFFNVVANGQMVDPKGYADLVIRKVNGAPVRIRDIGWVQLGAESYDTIARFNGKPVVGVGVVPLTKSNAIDISNEVKKALAGIRALLPKGVAIKVAMDVTDYIRDSIREVTKTLFITFVLVSLVVLIFLRTLRATIIPVLAIPVSIIGAFAGMWVAGFSINVLTLFSLVLAIGLVIDDAIIMLENIYRRQELGEAQQTAAFKGAREIGFPVLATTATLIAIFIPLAFMQGNIGRLFREFALSVAVAVGLSGLVALTLTPMLCARILRLSGPRRGRFSLRERFFQWLQGRYGLLAEWAVRHRKIVGCFMLLNIAAAVGFYFILPKTFVPVEDQGYFLVIIKAPQGSNLWFTRHYLKDIEKEISEIPAVQHYFSAIGISIGGPASPRLGLVFPRLKPFDRRNLSQMEIVRRLFPKLMQIPGVLAFPINPPSLGEQATNQEVQFVVLGPSLKELAKINHKLLDEARGTRGMINVQSDLTTETPQLNVNFHRERSADLGIPVADVALALEVGLGGSHVSDFIMNNKSYEVLVQLEPKFRAQPGQINDIYVRDQAGKPVPLSYLASLTNTFGPDTIFHYNLQRSFTISASLQSSLPLDKALNDMEAMAEKILPSGYSTALTGQSRDYRETSSSLYITFAVSLVFIYLVLAAQFESWVHPLTIMFSVPLALTGALLALIATGNNINLYSEIGIILLIGLVTKNGILMVDYANRLRAQGEALIEAAVKAARIRFRPILMTSLAMIMGGLPLALATGPGSQSRQPLGWAVVGGLIFSTLFTLLVTPVFYILITRLAERLGFKTIPPGEDPVGQGTKTGGGQ
jgi:multidrug efflux pump